jgi:lipid A ethanolaminephosphotransferase
MGSHGPAYYKRYPEEFRVYVPTCDTSQLDECTEEEINNAYDNTILYTDYFLSRVIDFLQSNNEHFETGMIYVSDHGESLGEYGMYLHGLPFSIAPDTQTQVPVIMWFGENYSGIDMKDLQGVRSKELSHDNVFHTVLGMFEIKSTEYDPKKDILQLARDHSGMDIGLKPTQ